MMCQSTLWLRHYNSITKTLYHESVYSAHVLCIMRVLRSGCECMNTGFKKSNYQTILQLSNIFRFPALGIDYLMGNLEVAMDPCR